MLTEPATRLATASRSAIRTYKGIGVSPGIAIGRAVIIERREAAIYRVPIRDDEVPSEVNRFLEAIEKTQTQLHDLDRKSTRLNSSHTVISYAVFCLKKKKKI